MDHYSFQKQFLVFRNKLFEHHIEGGESVGVFDTDECTGGSEKRRNSMHDKTMTPNMPTRKRKANGLKTLLSFIGEFQTSGEDFCDEK